MSVQTTRRLTLLQLFSQLDAFHSSPNARPLHIFTVFPRIDIESMSQFARKAGAGAVVERQDGNLYTLRILSARKRQHAYGYLIDHGKYWHILIRTVESPTVAGNVAKLWLKRLYPVVCRAYAKSEDLLTIMDALAKTEESKLGLRAYILRAHDEPETMKKWPRDKPYSREEIERVIQRENKLLDAVDFVFQVKATSFNVRIDNKGHFVFYKGGPDCFSNFYRLVLSRFDEIALMNRKFFSNRERRILDGEAEISKISLDPAKNLTKNDLQNLSMHLGMSYSTAVLHSGNPWLSMNVIDRGDGSSFDIYGYSSELQVVPFNKASPESLMRLIYNISEIFPLAKIAQPT